MDLIKEKIESSDEAELFVKWLKQQIVLSRPGVVSLFVDPVAEFVTKLREFCERFDSSKPLHKFMVLDDLLKYVAKEIAARKVEIVTTEKGNQANLGLAFPNIFNNKATLNRNSGTARRSNHVDFLNDHLSYLCNPYNHDDWKFLVMIVMVSDRKYAKKCSQTICQ